MAGYFKVSMDAARTIVNASEGPEMLAGYVTLCGYAFDKGREVTAAGAKSIRLTIGCTDFRSKRVMADLLSLDNGDGKQHGLLKETKRRKGNAVVYRLDAWEGNYAYLPSLLLERHPEYGSPLARLLAREDEEREVIRDALLLLLHVYANTDYAEWFGCPPDSMTFQKWRHEGHAGDDFELGYQGDMAGTNLWLVAEDEDRTWYAPPSVMRSLYGEDADQAMARFWAAWWCLKDSGLVLEVVSVQTRGRAYPLWVFSPPYRESLKAHGITADLGREAQLAACATGLDPDNLVIRYAVDECNRQGTGLFYCVGAKPIVRTVVVPRLHAPTPMNLDGLKEAAAVTKEISRKIQTARRREQSA